MKTEPGFSSSVMIFFMRCFLGGVYAYSGFVKLVEPHENFVHMLSQYKVLPGFLIPYVSHAVPWLEFLTGSFLILGYAPRISALILGLLSLGLMVVIAASGLLFGQDTSCGCFGVSGPQLTTRQIFLLDLANFFIGMRLFRIKRFLFSLDSWLITINNPTGNTKE